MGNTELELAQEALRTAREYYDEAHERAQQASRHETAALNALNKAQQNFDKAVAGVKANAPWNSDWCNRRGHAVEC